MESTETVYRDPQPHVHAAHLGQLYCYPWVAKTSAWVPQGHLLLTDRSGRMRVPERGSASPSGSTDPKLKPYGRRHFLTNFKGTQHASAGFQIVRKFYGGLSVASPMANEDQFHFECFLDLRAVDGVRQ